MTTVTSSWPQYCKGWLIMPRACIKSSHHNCSLVSFLTLLCFGLLAKWHHCPECHMWCSMYSVNTGQLSIYCNSAAWQLLHFALLAVYAQGVKAQEVQPIVFITLGSIKYLNVDNESLGYIFCCVFKMSRFVCFIMRGLGQSRSSLIHCR